MVEPAKDAHPGEPEAAPHAFESPQTAVVRSRGRIPGPGFRSGPGLHAKTYGPRTPARAVGCASLYACRDVRQLVTEGVVGLRVI